MVLCGDCRTWGTMATPDVALEDCAVPSIKLELALIKGKCLKHWTISLAFAQSFISNLLARSKFSPSAWHMDESIASIWGTLGMRNAQLLCLQRMRWSLDRSEKYICSVADPKMGFPCTWKVECWEVGKYLLIEMQKNKQTNSIAHGIYFLPTNDEAICLRGRLFKVGSECVFTPSEKVRQHWDVWGAKAQPHFQNYHPNASSSLLILSYYPNTRGTASPRGMEERKEGCGKE